MKYFAYGSNMSVEQMKSRGCVKSKPLGPARLNGHKFMYSGSSPNWDNKGTANIIEEEGSEVWGLLYEVTDRCLSSLDGFEHVPKRRERKSVEVIDHKNELHQAVIYTLIDDNKFNYPSDKYHNKVIESAQKAGLPKLYIDNIKAIKKDR
jgi:gamma-glutamylcyclotransferase (GGCT)/AIG2-like uncharacterized protein YtfP